MIQSTSGAEVVPTATTSVPTPASTTPAPASIPASDGVVDCAAGYTRSSGACTACQVGTFKATAGSGACDDCESGKFSSSVGASTCLSCSSFSCPLGQELRGCGVSSGPASGGSCQTCAGCREGTFKSQDCNSAPGICDSCGCKSCRTSTTCDSGQFLTACSNISDSRCQVCSICGLGQVEIIACSWYTDRLCASCNASSKPPNSEFTTVGSCAWRCKSGYALDSSSKCSDMQTAAFPQPLPTGVPVPSIAIKLQLTATKVQFMQRQESFIRAIARRARVNPNDVIVVEVTEVGMGQGRRGVALNVLTQVRTREPATVQAVLTLSTVNKALEQAGLPPAETMDVESVSAGEIPSALASSEPYGKTEESSRNDSQVDKRLIILIVSVALGVLLISFTILSWCRKSKVQARNDLRRGEIKFGDGSPNNAERERSPAKGASPAMLDMAPDVEKGPRKKLAIGKDRDGRLTPLRSKPINATSSSWSGQSGGHSRLSSAESGLGRNKKQAGARSGLQGIRDLRRHPAEKIEHHHGSRDSGWRVLPGVVRGHVDGNGIDDPHSVHRKLAVLKDAKASMAREKIEANSHVIDLQSLQVGDPPRRPRRHKGSSGTLGFVHTKPQVQRDAV